ncbi:MAG: N-6 DNA methylase [Muribaculaceae bacterium]|nr:N-6 DNA methylase [Muribaculaceae bacterium]
MAKKQNINYHDIESSLSRFKSTNIPAGDVGYEILKAFGKSDADIRRYKEGKGVLSSYDGLLIKGLFAFKSVTTTALLSTIEEMKNNAQIIKSAPKIIAVSDGVSIIAFDMREKETFDKPLVQLYCDFQFFYPLCGVERFKPVDENPADIKAAEKLAKLHDELRAYNDFSSSSDLHDLNIFIARLLFCFFAEDAGIFEENLFTGSIVRYTNDDGSDLADYLDAAFNVMDLRERNADTIKIISQFPYVNGGLFSKHISIPRMGYKARKIIIECGELNWQDINPDIFGSMIQAVVDPNVRANQGMHYTSVPNILKVINPLFLDELRAEFNNRLNFYDEKRRLRDVGMLSDSVFFAEVKPIIKANINLLQRIAKMKFFDPACGSGNFLIITYKMLRLLEMDILKLNRKCHPQAVLDFIDASFITLNQFYGIELLDFPHEVAMLSMWLAEHQMNKKLHDEFSVNTRALPLHNITQIVCGNACRLDWNTVCPHDKDDEVFIFGNPPYLGARLQEEEQKLDMEKAMGVVIFYNNLDYIATWFYIGCNYIANSNAKLAFVTTNSICQGEQVSLLWNYIFGKDVEISFAYHSFKWSNNAKYNAGVTCVIIGLRMKSTSSQYIFDGDKRKKVSMINPYLSEGTSIIVEKQYKSISGFLSIDFGNMANDGGALLLSEFEKDELIRQYPESEKLIKKFYGSLEFIRGENKYCLWISDETYPLAQSIIEVNKRIERCHSMRFESKREATNKLAQTPYKFGEIRYNESESIIIPRVSSERREYIPMGYLDAGTVISDSAFAIYDAETWLFGILESKMHMAWVRTVGGKLKTDYRYSAQLCYNTFPFPKITEVKREQLTEAAEEVLLARADHPEKTLAEMYDPDKMPQNLREAHNALDDIVDSCYPGYPFANDEARLECLFKLYEKMTSK